MGISMDILAAVFLSFAISALTLPFLIPFLIRLKVGQTERKEGVQAHLKKAGTPTMGGIAILVSVLVTTLVFAPRYPRILPVLVLTLGFGIIGFIDDFVKFKARCERKGFPVPVNFELASMKPRKYKKVVFLWN